MPWTNEPKTPTVDSFLLKEDDGFLLLEDGFKITLQLGWTNESKSA